jgi:predicted permease
LVYPPLSGLVMTCAGFALCALAVYFFGKAMGLTTSPQRRTFVLCAGMYNYGYMSYPLVDSLPSDGGKTLAALMLHNVGVEVAMWTVGLLILSGHLGRRWWSGVVNPIMIAIVAAVVLKFSGVWNLLPEGLHKGAFWLGNCAIPMGLLLTGATIADVYGQSNIRSNLGTVLGSSVMRLAVLPAVFLLVLAVVPTTPALHRVIAIQAAMPAAMFPIVLARHYGGDVPTAARVVIGTQILSIVTIPFWLTIGL